jgi:hypothetical protein
MTKRSSTVYPPRPSFEGTITPESMGFFFWQYLEKIKFAGRLEEAGEAFQAVFSDLFEILNLFLQTGAEGQILAYNCLITLRGETDRIIMELQFASEIEAKTYDYELAKFRLINPNELRQFGIDPNNPDDPAVQATYLVKSKSVSWAQEGEKVKIIFATKKG